MTYKYLDKGANYAASEADFERGFANGNPEPKDAAQSEMRYMMGNVTGDDSGYIENQAEYNANHGFDGEYGFVRRPLFRTDVERS